jgi:WD40 repeat protein
VTASGDKTAKVWNTQTGAELFTLKGHLNDVRSASFSPDGSRILTAGNMDQTAKVWDVKTGAEVFTLRGHTGAVYTALFSPDGSHVVTTGGSDKTARVWDARTGAEVHILKVQVDSVQLASFSPDASRIVTTGVRDKIRVWDARTGAELLTLARPTDNPLSVSFSRDGSRILIAGGRDKTARVWDAQTGAELLTLKGQNVVRSASFSPNGARILTVDGRIRVGKARVWDARTSAEVLTFNGPTDVVGGASFSPDGRRLVMSDAKTARVWDAQTGAEALALEGHNSKERPSTQGVSIIPNVTASFSPDGSRIVTGGNWDKFARVWDAHTGAKLLTLQGHADYVDRVSFSRDGSRIAISGGNSARVLDARTGAEVLSLPGLVGPEAWFYPSSFSPDGSRIVTFETSTTTARVWDSRTGAELLAFKGTEGIPSFSPDGLRIVDSGANSMTPKVWDAQTGAELLTLKGHTGPVYSAWFSPDGSRIVTASYDNTAKLWEAHTGVLLLTLKGHANGVYSASFSPDGSRIVTVSGDNTVKIWDATPINRQVVLANRFPAVLRGEDQPADNADRLAFAQMACETKRYVVATKLWAKALEADPKLGDDNARRYRYLAARTAALAVAGQGQDEPSLDDAAKARFRRQALNWLKANLSARKRAAMIIEPGNKKKFAEFLADLKQLPDLASIRDEKELARLPEEERKEWQSLWADVEVLLKQTRGATP